MRAGCRERDQARRGYRAINTQNMEILQRQEITAKSIWIKFAYSVFRQIRSKERHELVGDFHGKYGTCCAIYSVSINECAPANDPFFRGRTQHCFATRNSFHIANKQASMILIRTLLLTWEIWCKTALQYKAHEWKNYTDNWNMQNVCLPHAQTKLGFTLSLTAV
jgi:hypothetical protein